MLKSHREKGVFGSLVTRAFDWVVGDLKPGAVVLAMGVTCVLFIVAPAHSQETTQDQRVRVDNDGSAYAGHIKLPVNKSKVLRIASPFKELMVGNKDIADVLAMSDRTVYVLGKSVGSTSLLVYGSGKRLLAVLDLQVTSDTQGLKYDLFNLMPDENVNVLGSAEGIVLSGQVGNSLLAAQAQDLAERYAPGNVSNFLSIEQSQQVMLTVRFAEVKRSVAKKLGLNSDVFIDQGGADFMTVMSGILAPDAFATVLGSFTSGQYGLDIWLDALEKKGVLTTLAEPTLIALSGEKAHFLAGGEFPIPVSQNRDDDGGLDISIEFKEFGVSLDFLPTVVGDVISLTVAPEVSALDETVSVEFEGLRIPALVTRRAVTTVELRDGQSFAIAGLLQSEFKDSVQQFPGLGDLPIIGALLRSADYKRSETELVIIVTPHLVKPVARRALTDPTKQAFLPSEFELFTLGFMEAHLRNGLSGVGTASAVSNAGGLDGPLGYVNEEEAGQ